MNGYCKAYRIEAMQYFPAWQRECDMSEMIRGEDTLCYLWDDFIVRSSPIRREKTLFRTITPEWVVFCKEQLHFELPGEIFCNLQSAGPGDENSLMQRNYIPFTSGQGWLLEELSAADQYYCNIVFSQPISRALPGITLEEIMKYMMDYHDALRLRIVSEDGTWCQFVTGTSHFVPLTWVCASCLSADDQRKVVDRVAVEMQLQINTLQGYLWLATFCEVDDVKSGCILWSANHFIYDGFSVETLLQDFYTLYRQAYQGKTLCLPPKTTSFEEWTGHVSAYLRTAEAVQELREYWLKLPWHQVKPFPLDFPAGCSIDPRSLRLSYGARASSRVVTVALGAEHTQKLLTKVVNRHTQIMDVFLTAMVLTLTAWNDSSVLSIFVEDHARLTMFDDIDLLRTVGYIAQADRLLLDLGSTVSPLGVLATIKKQLRQAPNNGRSLDWFLRRSDSQDVPDELKQLPFADIFLNFRGRVNNHRRKDGVIFLQPLSYEQSFRNHVLACDATITEDDAQFTWEYSSSLHLHATIESLATRFLQVLQDLISLLLRSDEVRIE